MLNNSSEIVQLLPQIVVGLGIIFSLIIEITTKESKSILPWFTILIFAIAGFLSFSAISDKAIVLGGMLEAGGKPAVFNTLFSISAIIMVLSSIKYIDKYGAYFGEFYILVQSSVLGMMLMASAKSLFMIFLGLELMSICFYILTGINRKKLTANEASMKYFLLGAFATGFVVYGIGLIYGAAHSMSIDAIMANFKNLSSNIIFITGFILLLIGFSFKIAAFPFHMWVPDVYQGAPTTVTGLMSTAGKVAAFSVIIILLTAIVGGEAPNTFRDYFIVIALFSTLYGSIVAIAQDNLKRLLAYSSITHAGYMAIGLAAGNLMSVAGIIFYLAAYTFMNLGAFGVISIIEGENDTRTGLKAFAGLGSKKPILAGFMALFMFALAGIPPLAGFFGKYYVFVGAIQGHLTWLAIVGIVASVISVYYYLRVVVYMYFKESQEEFTVEKNYSGMLAIALSGLFVIILGVFPDTLMKIITSVLK